MLKNFRLLTFLLILMLTTACGSGTYLSDREMEEKLNSFNVDFTRLVEMFQQDSHLLKVDREFAYVAFDTKTTLPSQRMNEYHDLFSKLGLIEAGRAIGAKDIWLTAWHQKGFMMGGLYKHYVYTETTPTPIVNSLDDLMRNGHEVSAYKRIANNWYLNLDIW